MYSQQELVGDRGEQDITQQQNSLVGSRGQQEETGGLHGYRGTVRVSREPHREQGSVCDSMMTLYICGLRN